ERDDDYRRSSGDSGGSQGGMYGRGDFGNERGRDEYGRFSSDDDYRASRGGGRGGYEDDRGSRGRADHQGRGWFGDPEGHAEAARERWDESRGSRYEQDDDRGVRGGSMGRGNDRERDDQGR